MLYVYMYIYAICVFLFLGYQCADETKAPQACPPGYYTDQTGQETCITVSHTGSIIIPNYSGIAPHPSSNVEKKSPPPPQTQKSPKSKQN